MKKIIINKYYKSLAAVDEGEQVQVVQVSNLPIKRRLLDIGLTEGTAVRCLFKSGDRGLSACLIRGAVIALRKEDCAGIEVK